MIKKRKYAVGGEIGNVVNFRGDYGKKRSGIITGKKNGGYTVATDDGNVFVESYEIDGFEEAPIAKKKRFGFFEGGGEIEGKISDLKSIADDESMPEFAREKAKAEIERLEKELHESNETKGEWTTESLESELNYYKNLLRNIDKPLYKDYNKKKVEEIISELEDKLHESKETKSEEKEEHSEHEVYIDFLNKEKNFKKDRKYFETYNDAVKFGKSEIEKFNMDMIKFNDEYKEKAEDYVEAKTKALEKSIKDKNTSEVQRKRDEKELALFKKAKAPTKKEVKHEVKFKKGTTLYLKENFGRHKKGDEVEVKYDFIPEYDDYVNVRTTKGMIKETFTISPDRVSYTKQEMEEPKSKFNVGDKVLVKDDEGDYEVKEKKYMDHLGAGMTWAYKLPTYAFYVRESDLKEFKAPSKPKPDHKKLLAKIKAKKTVTPSNAPSKGHKRNEASDKKRDALPLGKRISASGSVYYENRLNRADMNKEDKFEGGGEIGKNSSGWGLKFLKW